MERPLIAVVNQDTLFLELMQDFLSEEGYEVFIEKHDNPDHSFQAVLKRKPNLVVLDILLTDPEVGFTVLNLMRLHPETAHIPVIICSTDGRFIAENEERLRNQRCDILMKPFGLEDLLIVIGKHLPMRS